MNWGKQIDIEMKELGINLDFFLPAYMVDYHSDDLLNLHSVVIKGSYFALTTISTVGFGDLHPINNKERALMIIIFLAGVNMFSFLLNVFMDVII